MTRDWEEIKAEAIANGELTHEGLAQAERELDDYVRSYLLSEVRKNRHVTQAQLAQLVGVGQPRISQIERGDLSKAEVSTLRAYVEALGGKLEIMANFGDQRISIA